MKKIIIIGATSGIGKGIAEYYAQRGCIVGAAGRRTALLDELKRQYPNAVYTKEMDVCDDTTVDRLHELIDEMGGMDVLFINAGYGKQTEELELQNELQTAAVNVKGFTTLVVAGYNYFKEQQTAGHIVATSSVASVRALRQAPAYSASKRYMRHYVDCLAQRAKHEKLNIRFTTLMPGFIETDFIKDGRYPLVTSLAKANRIIFAAIEKKKRSIYLPFYWNFIVFFWRLIPKFIWERYC